MAKWRFGINKTMWILVAKSHKNLLAKTHTFSSQSRKKKGKKEFVMCGNQTRTLHHTRSIKDLARFFCGKHYWQKLTEIYLQKLMHFIESGFDSTTYQFFFLKSPFLKETTSSSFWLRLFLFRFTRISKVCLASPSNFGPLDDLVYVLDI